MTDAQTIYQALTTMPGEWTIEDLARLTRLSKTRVRQALQALDDEGAIALSEGEHE